MIFTRKQVIKVEGLPHKGSANRKLLKKRLDKLLGENCEADVDSNASWDGTIITLTIPADMIRTNAELKRIITAEMDALPKSEFD